MAVAGYPGDGVHIARAADDPAPRAYTEPGLNHPDPGGDEYYWRTVSGENVTGYETDVVRYSLRATGRKALLDKPTFARLPAAEAGQVYPWEFSARDYVAQARTIDRLAEHLANSRRVT